jgi:diguanylate cyclase (GGDEF)-like protein
MITLPQEGQLLAQFRQLWGDYVEADRQTVLRLERGAGRRYPEELGRPLEAAFAPALAKLDALTALVVHERSKGFAQGIYERARQLTILMIVAAGICGGVAVFWTKRHVGLPILRISEAMRRVAAGDLTIDVDGGARRDEIGTLAGAVAGYRDSLRHGRQLIEAAERERTRLQAAINHMPVGLCMFDRERRLVISNDRYAEMYGLPVEEMTPGVPLEAILRARIAAGSYPGGDPEEYIAASLAVVDHGVPWSRIVELPDGRVFSILHEPVPDGGWVAIHKDVTEQRRAEEQIQHMARHDALTDLPNRVLLREQIDEALKRVERDEQVAVLCLDLDRFKNVNDSLGHPVGDRLLSAVAERLRRCVRTLDTVARLGGDEFAVIQVGAEQPGGAVSLARRLIEALSAPHDIDGQQIVIGTSVGIAVAPTDGHDPDQLLKHADLALYRAKGEGRGIYRCFEPEMNARMQSRRALELELRQALAQGELELFYQPVIHLATGAVGGLEALMRWRHPRRGLIAPDQFVWLAEEIGLIVPLGEWVLHQACAEAARWRDDIKVAVNLSPVQFRSPHLVEAVTEALAAAGLPACRLELEITETVLLMECEGTLAKLHALRRLGVQIAMDDFGTGYSSLSYLQTFPFDTIKIDCSFVAAIGRRSGAGAIVRAIIDLARSLGMRTCAEGVETAEQLAFLRGEGCDDVQGFHFSRALPAAAILPFLAAPAVIGGAAPARQLPAPAAPPRGRVAKAAAARAGS